MASNHERGHIARRLIVLGKGGISIAGIDERVLIPNIVAELRKAEEQGAARGRADADRRVTEAERGMRERCAEVAESGFLVEHPTRPGVPMRRVAGSPEHARFIRTLPLSSLEPGEPKEATDAG